MKPAIVVIFVSLLSPAVTQSDPYVLKRNEGEVLTDRQHRINIVKVSPKTGSKSLAMGTQELPTGSRILVHKHERTEEILYISEGHGTLLLEGEPIKVEPDSTVWIPPGTWHGIEADTENMHLIWVVTPPGLDEFMRGISWPIGAQSKELTAGEIRALEKKHDSVTR